MKFEALRCLPLVLLSACTCAPSGERSAESNQAPAPSASDVTPLLSASASLTVHTGKTTPADIALNNLNAQLEGQVKLMAVRPTDLSVRAAVVSILLARFKVLGKSDDLTRAIDLAEEATKIEQKSFAAMLLRARGRAAAHRFEEALVDLDLADKLAGPLEQNKTSDVRASIFMAVGRYDEALPIVARAARLHPDSGSLADQAYLFGLMGKLTEAEALFIQAEQKHRGTSPFGLVQIYLDRANMWEKQGSLTEATALYRAAHARLPQQTHVAVHLAGLVSPREGIAILEPLVDTTDDPDVFAELGTLENLVKEQSGDAMLQRAKNGYDQLFAKLPEAYADHAGWFWTTTGGDPQKALTAAQTNVAVRKTADAYELLIAAAAAAKNEGALCAGLKGANSLNYSTPLLRERVRQQAAVDCSRGGLGPESHK